MTDLLNLKCIPCHGGIPPLSPEEIESLHPQVADWQVTEQDGVPRLVRTLKVKNFTAALGFGQSDRGNRQCRGSSPGAPGRIRESHGELVDARYPRLASKRFHHGRQNRPAGPVLRVTLGETCDH